MSRGALTGDRVVLLTLAIARQAVVNRAASDAAFARSAAVTPDRRSYTTTTAEYTAGVSSSSATSHGN